MHRGQAVAVSTAFLIWGVTSACAPVTNPETRTPSHPETLVPSLLKKADTECLTGQNQQESAYATAGPGQEIRVDDQTTFSVTKEGEPQLNGQKITVPEKGDYVTQPHGSRTETLIIVRLAPPEANDFAATLFETCVF